MEIYFAESPCPLFSSPRMTLWGSSTPLGLKKSWELSKHRYLGFPNLSRLAHQFVGPITATDSSIFPDPADNEDFRKPAGKKKATAGCISSILKPGKAIQVSIQDNGWLKHEKALELPRVVAVQRFVDQILGIVEASKSKAK